MRLGTPGFIGTRLREAREARGMSPQQLADVLGVSKQAISQYESALQTPRPEVMDRLPAVLNVKSKFFFLPSSVDEGTPLFHRSLKAATKRDRQRARRRQEWQFEVIAFVESLVELPPLNLPALDLPSDPTDITSEMIESAATSLRRFWNLGDGVISDLVLLLENNGIVVSRGELWADELDAFSRWRRGRPFVFLGSDKESAVRSRLDAAHELAHILLHQSVSDEQLAVREIFNCVETQAFHFAGAFLLPQGSFSSLVSFPSLDLFRALKPSLRVSIGGMLKRAEQLGLISDARPLWKKYRRRQWHREEPFDREMLPEQPRVLRHAIELLLEANVTTREEIVSRFGFPAKDIEELAGLPHGYLESAGPPVRLLNFPIRNGAVQNDVKNGTVIPFAPRRHAAD